jgi:AbrB family looped-hinge helix DNA binding protein
MAQTATISSKGQVVIPAALRKKYKLGPRTKVVFGEQNGKLTMKPCSNALEDVLALCGKYAGLPLEETLKELRQQEEARLEALYEDLRS